MYLKSKTKYRYAVESFAQVHDVYILYALEMKSFYGLRLIEAFLLMRLFHVHVCLLLKLNHSVYCLNYSFDRFSFNVLVLHDFYSLRISF